MRSVCSTAAHSIARGTLLALAALFLASTADAARPQGVDGDYRHAGRVAATLEVRRVPEGYAVRLVGGASLDAGPGAAADCVVTAHGPINGKHFAGRFDPVETDAFAFSAEQAAREQRMLRIVFGHNVAQVTEAETFGYCGLGATFLGRYRLIRSPERRARSRI